MASKSFHKDMDAYLERRSGGQPVVVKKKSPKKITFMEKVQAFFHKCTTFFISADNINLSSLNNDVTVIKHSSSPASMFMRKMKQLFAKKQTHAVKHKVEEKPEERDIDPALVAQTIKNNRL